MAGKKKKPIWLYLVIVLCLAASGAGLWSMLGRVREYEEGEEAYQQLQEEVAAQSAALLSPEEIPTEEPYVSQGLEEEEDDQDETMRLIEQNRQTLAESFAVMNGEKLPAETTTEEPGETALTTETALTAEATRQAETSAPTVEATV